MLKAIIWMLEGAKYLWQAIPRCAVLYKGISQIEGAGQGIQQGTAGVEESDCTEERTDIRIADKGKRAEKTAQLSAGRQKAAEADGEEKIERLIEQMKQAQGITEQLKGEDAWEWVGRMNNIQACAREIVDKEIIYAQK